MASRSSLEASLLGALSQEPAEDGNSAASAALDGSVVQIQRHPSDLIYIPPTRGYHKGSAFPTVAKVSEDFAVHKNLPVQVLESLELVKPSTERVTEELWYKDDGSVAYEEPKDSDHFKYARLFTKNSFDEFMISTFLSVYATAAGTMTHACFMLNIFAKGPYDIVPTSMKTVIVAFFAVASVVWLVGSACEASRRLKTDEAMVGDYVQSDSILSKIRLGASMTVINMLAVPRVFQDIPSLYHPRKARQPFGVFKKHGSRIWVFGWPTKDFFQFEQTSKRLWRIPVVMFVSVPVICLQAYILIKTRFADWVLWMSFFWSCFTCTLTTANLLTGYMLRNRVYNSVKNKLEELALTIKRSNDMNGTAMATGTYDEYLVLNKFMKEHFGEEFDPEAESMARHHYGLGQVGNAHVLAPVQAWHSCYH